MFDFMVKVDSVAAKQTLSPYFGEKVKVVPVNLYKLFLMKSH